jgi:ribosomal protein S18 acetylase RimI-like enzyme
MHVGDPVQVVNDVTIEPLCAEQWRDLKRLRIAALTDAPDAFAPTAAEACSHDDAYWQRAAQRAATTPGFRLLVARRDGEGLGLASAQCDGAGTGHIGAMWVDPSLRGAHIGARLFDAAVEFLSGQGCVSIELSVTESNATAIGLYRSRGFELTGAWAPLRDGSRLRNLTMRWRGS